MLAALTALAQRLDKPGLPARRIGTVETPAQSGITVDVKATLAQVMANFQQAGDEAAFAVPLAVTTLPPPPPVADTASASTLNLAVQQPLLLRAEQGGVEFALDPATLSRFALSTAPLRLDETAVHDYLATLAPQVEIPPRDARLRFDPDTGAITVLQSSQPGRMLDVDATVTAIQEALASGSDTARLALVETAPAVDSNRIAEMGIRELVAQGSTYFAGSSASRVRNIEVAAEKFDGVVIPPDGLFSFNEVVRDVSAANGFEDSLVIWGDRTAVGVGGGVCQVSTTVFRTAYEGGFPIVERYNHGYVVGWYGEPGMDATIFTPSVDFKFRNDTGAYLLLEPVVDSVNGVITFNFYGTRPDRTVSVGEPEITDVKQPEPPQYVVDETPGEGETKAGGVGKGRHDCQGASHHRGRWHDAHGHAVEQLSALAGRLPGGSGRRNSGDADADAGRGDTVMDTGHWAKEGSSTAKDEFEQAAVGERNRTTDDLLERTSHFRVGPRPTCEEMYERSQAPSLNDATEQITVAAP